MLFTDDRTRTRDLFRQAFKKHRANEPLEPLEKQVATLVEEHPEYHSLIVGTDDVLDQDFTSEHGGAEHRMLPLLADMLWEAQRQGRAPDEAGYLDRLRSLL